MHIRDAITDAAPVTGGSFETGSGMTILATANSTASGTIQLRIEASVTKNYTFDSAVYDIEIEDPASSTVTRLLQGSIKLSPEVTR